MEKYKRNKNQDELYVQDAHENMENGPKRK